MTTGRIAAATMLCMSLGGCVSADADVKLDIRDKESKQAVAGCYWIVEEDSQTMAHSFVGVMPQNLGTARSVNIKRIDSPYRYELHDVSFTYMFWVVFLTSTSNHWNYMLVKEGYVPRQFTAFEIHQPKQLQDGRLVVEMKRYQPGRDKADDVAVFSAGCSACHFPAPPWDGDANAVRTLLADMVDGYLKVEPRPQPPDTFWTREQIERLAKALRNPGDRSLCP